uniref:Uncharacterized protein n=1 Tax=Avena sativa TaxID=4498 RepID=A0ACD5T7R9_AVESA
MARPRGRKRTAAEADGPSDAAAAATVRPGKRAKATPKPEAEYFPEKRNLEDLWLSAFPIGTEEFKWNFQNLEKALEEGGELYGKTVYLFGSTEPQLLNVAKGEQKYEKMVLVPIVVAVECPVPPSDKVGIKSVQRENEEIVPVRSMKMAWVPYVPLEDRLSRIDRLKTEIFTLCCTQRWSALKHLKIERVKKFDYCMPYYMPLSPEDDHDTTVDIIYPLEQPIVRSFDWEMDDYEDFIGDLVKEEVLPEDEKEKFKEFLKKKVRERKTELRQAKEARKEAIDKMDPELKKAFENIQFYKFYPVNALDAPDLSIQKVNYINRYYGKAHKRM